MTKARNPRRSARARRGARPVRPPGLAHAVFLDRASDAPETAPEVRLGQGAFLVLRLVDLFAPGHEPVEHEVFQRHWMATDRYCAELVHEGPEAQHLGNICTLAADAHRTGRFERLRAALAGYGTFVEDGGADHEAADVFRTAARTAQEGEETRAAPFWLRAGAASARAGQWEDAEEAFRAARRYGDHETRLLVRAGRADVLRAEGRLEDGIAELEKVLRAARRARFEQAERVALLGLARAFGRRREPVEAAIRAWSAFTKSASHGERAEAAVELGARLEQAGALDFAAQAYALAERHPRDAGRSRALIGLLRVSAARGDRMSFERWRRALKSIPDEGPRLTREAALEILCEVARGCARFGQRVQARNVLDGIVLFEREWGLAGRVAAVERELDALARDRGAPKPQSVPDALAPVVAGLRELAG
jgi:tetratricopeptide (TPR) repeat protein